MGKLADEIRRLTSDLGARRLAEEVEKEVEKLQQRLETCCPSPVPVADQPIKEK
jgi:hypothetical protein